MKEEHVPIPQLWCTCGKLMYWCGVRQAYVDSAHRASHDVPLGNGGRTNRQPHNTQGMKEIPRLEEKS